MKRIILVSIAILSVALLSVTSKKEKKENFRKDYVYIPSGTFYFEENPISVAAFMMLKTEVTNKQYREFILDLKSQGREADYLIAVPDSSKWESKGTFNKPFADYYFNHPAYENYPVVNVTQAGTNLYCIWLTKKMRLKYPQHNFNDFRLPSKPEWIYAAKGGLKYMPYPWEGPFVVNSEGKYWANFTHVGNENITTDSLGNFIVSQGHKKNFGLPGIRHADYLSPSKSYYPNGYGLYNMAGNAAELVARDTVAMGGSWRSPGFDIRVTSQESATKSKPTIGFRVVTTYTPS